MTDVLLAALCVQAVLNVLCWRYTVTQNKLSKALVDVLKAHTEHIERLNVVVAGLIIGVTKLEEKV